MKKRKKIITIKTLDGIPRKFKSEDAERRFWETHGLSTKLWDELYDPKVDKEAREMTKRLKMTDRRR